MQNVHACDILIDDNHTDTACAAGTPALRTTSCALSKCASILVNLVSHRI